MKYAATAMYWTQYNSYILHNWLSENNTVDNLVTNNKSATQL